MRHNDKTTSKPKKLKGSSRLKNTGLLIMIKWLELNLASKLIKLAKIIEKTV